MRWLTVILPAALALVGSALALRADEAAPQTPLPAGKSCQGTLRLSGKTYKLEHIVVYETKLNDHEAINVLLCDQPIPVDKLKAALREGQGSDDRFSLFQPKVTITFSQQGKPLYCSAWAANTSLSISGSDDLKGKLTNKDGRVRGSTSLVRTDKPGSKDGFDARFDVALLVNPIPKAQPKLAAAGKPRVDPDDDDKPANRGPVVRVRDLPIPKDATDVEYKQLVEHIGFKSKSDVKTLSAWLAKNYKQQGWKAPDDDLVTPASAILQRTKGAAELTIFVKPDGAGSKVTITSAGLAWDENDSAGDDE